MPPPPPIDFYPLTDELQRGMIPLAIFALCSALSTFTLLSWITYRLVWRQDYQAFVGYNQYVILIYNLLLADFQQSLSFLITLNWLKIGGMESPSTVCFAQAWLLNMGDVSSGFFVLAIALHTWYSVVLGRKLNYAVFTVGILSVWAAAFILTVMGPVTKGSNFFAKTNAWVSWFQFSVALLLIVCYRSVGLTLNTTSIVSGSIIFGFSRSNSAPSSSTPTSSSTYANAFILFVPSTLMPRRTLVAAPTASPKQHATWSCIPSSTSY